MERTAARSRVTRHPEAAPVARWTVEAARPDDDPGLRELLRRRAMGGLIRLTLEREPCVWHAAAVEGERHHTVVARERATGKIVGLGSRAVRQVWVDGERARLGYLAQLRLAPELRAGRRLLAAGYRSCDRERREDELPYDLTSIVADNVAARRLLERGLPGLPRYHRLCRLVTLTLPTRRRRLGSGVVRQAGEDQLPAIVQCLERNLSRYQYAPAWTEADLRSTSRSRGLKARDFLVVSDPADDGQVAGCAAIWDQRSFKQVVVRDYAPALRRFRPLLNLMLVVAGRPRLPPPGSSLDLAYLSHLAVDGDRPEVAVELIRAARHQAACRGLDYLALSLAESHPLLPAVRRAFPARELSSVLYLVGRGDTESRLPSFGGTSPAAGDRIPYVEAAIL